MVTSVVIQALPLAPDASKNSTLMLLLAKLNTLPSTVGFSVVSISTTISVPTSSTMLLAANALRTYCHFINNDNYPIWVQYGGVAVVGRGMKLKAGGILTLTGHELFLGTINAISQSSPTLVDVLEGH